MLTKIKNRLTLRLFPFILYFMAVRKENTDDVLTGAGSEANCEHPL